MTGLSRTDLSTSRKVELAASALGQQGQHGAVSCLARVFGVARGTVYSAKGTASEVLTTHFDRAKGATTADEAATSWPPVRVDEAQIRRAIAALRVVVPGTLRPIEELLPILYPGLRLSYGTVQAIAVDAESRAAAFNAGADLSGITAAALDELFSQGQPVLGGIDLDSGYACCLELRDCRGAEDWAEVLRKARARGMNLSTVVKDAALGIAAGTSAVYPECEQRDDCFHAKYEVGKVRRIYEQRAFGAIAREEEVSKGLAAAQARGEPVKAWHTRLWWAKGKCATAIELHDKFEQATKLADEALEFVDMKTGSLRTAGEAEQMLRQAAQAMMALSEPKATKAGRYLLNRAPGLVKASQDLEEQLSGLARAFGDEPVALACRTVRILRGIDEPRHRWQRTLHERLLLAALSLLQQQCPDRADGLIRAVDHFIQIRHRASSAIEGFNAALRPHLYLHRGATQGFLELFRAYFNLRTRRSGPYPDMSAHERMTGQRVTDWLAMIGLPPSAPCN
jgi:hypothetical protein